LVIFYQKSGGWRNLGKEEEKTSKGWQKIPKEGEGKKGVMLY